MKKASFDVNLKANEKTKKFMNIMTPTFGKTCVFMFYVITY